MRGKALDDVGEHGQRFQQRVGTPAAHGFQAFTRGFHHHPRGQRKQAVGLQLAGVAADHGDAAAGQIGQQGA